MITRIVHFLKDQKDRGLDVVSGCLVGKTKVFFRAEQLRALDKQLHIVRPVAAKIVQRFVRGAVTRKYTTPILAAVKSTLEAIKLKTIKALEPVVEKMNREIMPLITQLEVVLSSALIVSMGSISYGKAGSYSMELDKRSAAISEEFLEVLFTHRDSKAAIEDILKKVHIEEVSIYDIFDDLNIHCKTLQGCYFKEEDFPFKNDIFEYKWNDDVHCITLAKQVAKFGKIVLLKRRFDQYLGSSPSDGSEQGGQGGEEHAQVSEIELTRALEDLNMLRAAGEIPVDYCKEEELAAKKVIHRAANIYRSYYDKVHRALLTGPMTLANNNNNNNNNNNKNANKSKSKTETESEGKSRDKRKSISSNNEPIVLLGGPDMPYSVDSKSLAAVLKEWNEHAELHEKSQQTVELLDMLSTLHELRRYAEKGKWETLWGAIRSGQNPWVCIFMFFVAV